MRRDQKRVRNREGQERQDRRGDTDCVVEQQCERQPDETPRATADDEHGVAHDSAEGPLAVFEDARPFRAVVRDAALVVGRRPWGFAGLGLALLLVNVIGVAAAILPFLTLTIAYSFLVSAHFALPKNPAREV